MQYRITARPFNSRKIGESRTTVEGDSNLPLNFNNFSDRRNYALLDVYFCYLNFYTCRSVGNMIKRIKAVSELDA
jgi:hypothetical protein